jgi:pyruvate dehydrogenase E2 component (dihydrolipoamide acetyltransferase)
MVTKVHMEALSPTMEEGQLVRWLKSEGDQVSNGEILAEIETDKATMELVARGDGVLRRILLGEGGVAPVGEIIAVIALKDEDIGDLDSDSGLQAAPGPEEGPEAPSHGPDDPPLEQEKPPESPPAVGEGDEPGERERVRASPVARRLAQEARLDLNRVQGSGPGGRIVKRDLEGAGAPGVAVKAADLSAYPARGESGADFEDVPLSQMRKTIARRLAEYLGPVPHFFLRISVEMGRVLAARKTVNRLLEAEGEKVSINDFILKAVAQALAWHPEVNAFWTGDSIRRFHRVHLGVAVAVEDGLITPVVRDADAKGILHISREVRELAARGKDKRLLPEEYTGSTFSVSNLGMFGIHEFTGVINPPEAGILAVGGVEDTPVVEGGKVVVRPLMKVTMSCDHRVIDGATGARFLQTLKGMLEEPGAILL